MALVNPPPAWAVGLRCRVYQYRSAKGSGTYLWVSPDALRALGNPERVAVRVLRRGAFALTASRIGHTVSPGNGGRRPTVWAPELADADAWPDGIYGGAPVGGAMEYALEAVSRPGAMPAADLDDALLEAVRSSGAVALAGPRPPRGAGRLLVRHKGEQVGLYVYLRQMVTDPGRRGEADQRGVVLGDLESPLEANPSGPTLLLGYDRGANVFAAWDFMRYRTYRGGALVAGVRRDTLVGAAERGMAVEVAGGGDLRLAIRPDHLVCYCLNAEEIHAVGSDARATVVLAQALRQRQPDPGEWTALPPDRRRVLRTVSQFTRSATFREQVLRAYGGSCAVTRWRMNVVEAAHILPVAAGEASIDHVRNGLALSPTYHRAFDQGLIHLNRNHVMALNPDMVAELARHDLADHIEQFARPLGAVLLPLDRRDWPDPADIDEANRYRGVR